MALVTAIRPARAAFGTLSRSQLRTYSSAASPATSSLVPRHFLSIADLTPTELTTLVRNAHSHKQAIKMGSIPKSLQGSLTGKTVAMTFSKRSTRTRVSTEAAVVTMGGHPMFLGKDDIQLGVRSPRAIQPRPVLTSACHTGQ
jgi:ornithine carbamoyltransferase